MGNVMAYSGITTKVRAMSAKLLKENKQIGSRTESQI